MFRSNPFTGCGFDQSPGVLVNFWWIVYLLISGGVLFYGLILNNLPDIYILLLYLFSKFRIAAGFTVLRWFAVVICKPKIWI